MSEVAKRLQERRQNVWNEAKELADRAADENRAFSGEEEGKWQTLNAELDALDKRIKSIIDGEQRAKDAEDSFAKLRGTPEANPPGKKGGTADADLDSAFRALASGERRSPIDVALPDYAERRSLVEQRTVLTSNAPLPTSFIGQLYQYLVDTSSIRQANPTVYTTSTGENLTIPRSTAEGQATWTAEGAALTPNDPTLSSVTLGAWKVGKVIFVSSELVTDTGFDLLGYLAAHAGRNIGIAVDAAYVNGDGSSKPSGFIGTAGTGKTGAVGQTTTVKGDDLIDLFHSVIPQYRSRASWIMHDSSVKVVRKLRDDTGGAGLGNFLWQPGLQAGQPDTLLGRPVYADPNMPVMAANAKSIAFGDFGGYWIRDVTPLRFDRSDDFKFDSDVVSFRALYRTDGKQGDTNAIKLYANSAT